MKSMQRYPKNRDDALQRPAINSRLSGGAPSIVHEVLAAPGQPFDAETRAYMEPRFGHDFSRVRIHADHKAADSAEAINALAYTAGQDIVFAAAQYSPTTTAGRKLLAHELAHVVQQAGQARAELVVGRPEDASEGRAEAAAHLALSDLTAGLAQVGTAPFSIQRQGAQANPFAGESATDRARRLDAIAALRNAITRLDSGLAGGYLWPFESLTTGGISVAPISAAAAATEATTARAARLKKLLIDLNRVVGQLESAPIPAGWLGQSAIFPKQGQFSATGPQAWQDAQMFYAHRSAGLGMDMTTTTTNLFYLEIDPIPTKTVKQAAISTGVQLGIYITVADEANRPLDYQRIDPYGAWNEVGEAIPVWKDEIGYYYIGKKGGRHYLPGRP